MLINAGCHLSFGLPFFIPPAPLQSIEGLPLDKILLETVTGRRI
jgi:hypothetical protein